MAHPIGASTQQASERTGLFFVLACAITWGCAAPATLAALRGLTPSPGALAGAGLSAFGPTLAAVLILRGRAGAIFGPWRVGWIWLPVALLLPMAIHIVARGAVWLSGGAIDRWVELPSAPEHVMALVVFSVGEEFGWRGYAQPRMIRRYGVVIGPLLLGSVWVVWHAMYVVALADTAAIGATLIVLVELPAYAVLFAWFSARAGGSIAVAIALHAGAHLDNLGHMPTDALLPRTLAVILVWVLAVFAARSLRRRTTIPGAWSPIP